MNYKGVHPNVSLLVSLENSSAEHDQFWKNESVLSTLQYNFVVLRLSKDHNENELNQFQLIFNIKSIPSLVYFAPNNPAIAHVWTDYPTPEILSSFFSTIDLNIPQPNIVIDDEDFRPIKKPKPKPQTNNNPQPPPSSSDSTRILIQGQNSTKSRIFKNTDTIGTLKQWIRSQFGPNAQVIITSTHLPLPDNDNQSLEESALTPSAVLQVIADIAELPHSYENNLETPLIEDQIPNATTERRCNFHCRIWKYVKLVFSFVNPWASDADDEEEQFWQYKPNPQLASDIINALRMGMPRY
ncbi:UBX domain containing protein [Histomonas meleagridis]|uniref:UBX domain containing protein n=1 Tax=Histomonas meleagridis TaxID=135588 RepID=UPI00355A2B9D|nr:UBX domain containing protein [Histomonas meleagridis]